MFGFLTSGEPRRNSLGENLDVGEVQQGEGQPMSGRSSPPNRAGLPGLSFEPLFGLDVPPARSKHMITLRRSIGLFEKSCPQNFGKAHEGENIGFGLIH
jgi:hypothetical protein